MVLSIPDDLAKVLCALGLDAFEDGVQEIVLDHLDKLAEVVLQMSAQALPDEALGIVYRLAPIVLWQDIMEEVEHWFLSRPDPEWDGPLFSRGR